VYNLTAGRVNQNFYKMKKSMISAFAVGLCMTVNLWAQVPNYVPTNGLVGWWPFNGNADDESGNGNNGSVNGATLTTDRFGNANKTYNFNGTNNFISVTNNNSLQTPNAISINFWVQFSGPGHGRLVSKGWSPDGIEVHTEASSNHKIRYGGAFNGLGYGPISQTTLLDNQWYMATTIDNGNVKYIYINGLLEDSLVHNYGSVPVSTIDVYFGKNSQNATDYLLGKLDDIGIWNRALTQQEITDLYNANVCYEYVTVTDTLVINTGITGYNPITYMNTLKIWPNPTNDHITIDAGDLTTMNGYSIKIEDAQGQQVFQNAVNQQQFYIDITTWGGNGLYFVRIIDPQGNTVDIKKIVLQ
jgi:hypothetical protein